MRRAAVRSTSEGARAHAVGEWGCGRYAAESCAVRPTRRRRRLHSVSVTEISTWVRDRENLREISRCAHLECKEVTCGHSTPGHTVAPPPTTHGLLKDCHNLTRTQAETRRREKPCCSGGPTLEVVELQHDAICQLQSVAPYRFTVRGDNGISMAASAPPVLASSGASRRPATIKAHCVASPARVRSGGRGRSAIFSRTSARSPSLSACDDP